MGLFDDLTTSDRIRIAEIQLSQLRTSLWSHLVACSIDPDTFDPTSWAGPEEWMGPQHPAQYVQDYLDQISFLEGKIAELGPAN